MPASKPNFVEGHEYDLGDGTTAVWGGKRGWMSADAYVAMKGESQRDFDDKRAIAERLRTARENANQGGATGFFGRLTAGEGVPDWFPIKGIGGTPGYNLDKELVPVRANAFIQNLQTMRNNSPTGGAVGNVSNSEGEKLSSTDAILDVGQSREQLQREIDRTLQAMSRHVPGLDVSNPVPLSQDNRTTIPQGAYFTAGDGKTYINRKGGPTGKASAPYDGRDERLYAAVPPGAYYIHADGSLRRKAGR